MSGFQFGRGLARAAALTLIAALSYGELAAMMPQAGGQYVFLREAYSPLWGFLYGWTCFLIIQTGSIAAVAVAFAKFLGVLVPALGTKIAIQALFSGRGAVCPRRNMEGEYAQAICA